MYGRNLDDKLANLKYENVYKYKNNIMEKNDSYLFCFPKQ